MISARSRGPASGLTPAGLVKFKKMAGYSMLIGKILRGNRGETGNIILEFALVLPLLLLIVAGTVDLGMLYWEKHVLVNASREGARAASRATVDGTADKSLSEVRQIVQNYLTKSSLKDDSGTALTLVQDTNFFYTWDTSVTPTRLTVELRDIPVRLMLLPNAQALINYNDAGFGLVHLSAKTTMAAEWTTHP